MSKYWYPIIDYEKCIGCLECYKFCPNGVYEIGSDGKPKVVHPEYCVDNCKACGKLCEQGAITFFGDTEKKGGKDV